MCTRSRLLIFLSLISGSTPALAGFDPPDLQLEYRFYQQWQNAQGGPAPLSPLARREDLRLQSGETLRTLSETLYGDAAYWPNVWRQAKGAANPHLVHPGHTLQFILGTEDQTPAFRFTENGDPETSGVELAASANGNPIVEIPPPDSPPKPVLRIPPSFPEWQSVFQKPPSEILDDRNLGKTQEKIPDRIWLTAYVQETPLVPMGMFQENDSEAGLPVVNQYVFIKTKKGMAHVGQSLLVVKDSGQIKRINSAWEDYDEAYLINVFAELEVTEQVPSKFVRKTDAETYDTFRALVVRTTGLSVKDCALIPGQLRTVDLDRKGTRGSTVATIIGSEKHHASTLFGPGEIVFLNKGANHGVAENQLLDIFVNRTTRQEGTPVVHSPAPSGTVKIVKVGQRVSTAVLLESREGVQQGDEVRELSSRRGDEERLDFKGGSSEPEFDDLEESPEDEGSSGGSVDSPEDDLENEMEESL